MNIVHHLMSRDQQYKRRKPVPTGSFELKTRGSKDMEFYNYPDAFAAAATTAAVTDPLVNIISSISDNNNCLKRAFEEQSSDATATNERLSKLEENLAYILSKLDSTQPSAAKKQKRHGITLVDVNTKLDIILDQLKHE